MGCCFKIVRKCMVDLSEVPVAAYPVTVYNVNKQSLGNAANATEYKNKWNADAANAALGTITATGGMCFFITLTNPGPTVPAGLKTYGVYSGTAPQLGNTELSVGTVSGGNVPLTLSTVPNATSYAILRSTNATTGFALNGTTTTNSYTDTSVAAGTYYYKAVPMASGYASGSSNTISATVAPASLQAPTLGTPKRSATAATVPVNNPAGGQSIIYQRSTDPAFGGTPATGSLSYPQTAIPFTGLALGATYYVRAKTDDGNGTQSDWSNVAQFTTYNTSLSLASSNGGGVNVGFAGTTGEERFDFNAIPLGNQSGSNTGMDGFISGQQEFGTTNTTDYNGTGFSYKDAAGNWHFEVTGGFVTGTKNIS